MKIRFSGSFSGLFSGSFSGSVSGSVSGSFSGSFSGSVPEGPAGADEIYQKSDGKKKNGKHFPDLAVQLLADDKYNFFANHPALAKIIAELSLTTARQLHTTVPRSIFQEEGGSRFTCPTVQ